MQYSLGLIALVIGIIGAIPYIIDTFKRKTKPHRTAWIIFLILSIINFASQYSLGARASLFFFGWCVCSNVILVSLSLRKNNGYGGISLVNVLCFLLAMASIVLWKTTSSALVALICVLVADGIGALLIVIKSYKKPYSETLIMWALGIIGSLLTVLAVGKLDAALLAAPVQLFVFNIAIVSAILIGKRIHPKPRSRKKPI